MVGVGVVIKFVCRICKEETFPRKKRKDQSIRMYCKCGNYMEEVEVNSPGEGFRRGGYLGDAIQ